MIEGVSGLLSVHRDGERPDFEPSKSQLTWPNGTVAQMFSADNPDSLRGPQFAAAWCDELAKWRTPETAWDMLQFGLRLGKYPQVAVTTTPRPIPLLNRLLADAAKVVTRAATAANTSNLSPGFIAEMTRRYAGTALGRQELDGEIVEDMSGALWQRAWIADTRVRTLPELARIVVAVYPPVTATAASDACGIVVAGLSPEGHGYVIADRTVQGREPHAWARAVIAAYHEFMADRVVAEVNQGGDLVVSVLRQIDAAVAVRKVHATRGKWLRAEPIAALYVAVTVPGRQSGSTEPVSIGPPEFEFLDLRCCAGPNERSRATCGSQGAVARGHRRLRFRRRGRLRSEGAGPVSVGDGRDPRSVSRRPRRRLRSRHRGASRSARANWRPLPRRACSRVPTLPPFATPMALGKSFSTKPLSWSRRAPTICVAYCGARPAPRRR